ncbi:MAG: hypothetical protein RM021_031755 [Nostoc sp. EkiNYC01]
MNTTNAQRRPEKGVQETRLVRREETTHESNVDSYNSQSLGSYFQSSKHQQIGSHRSNGQGENATVSLVSRCEDTGKISERLRLIEQYFLLYVRDRREQLEAELDANKTLEERFLTSLKELEREIDSLVPRQQNSEEDVDSNEQH